MDYHYGHRIGPHISVPLPAFYDLSQSSAYRTPTLPHVTETLKLPPTLETYEINAMNVGATVHAIELEAYTAVLKAFKIQSDLISWGKEGLITELRRELNVTDQEHRMLLMQINSDESIKMIRELQQGIFHTRETPSSTTYAPGFGPYKLSSTPRHILKHSSADVPTMRRHGDYTQPMPAPAPPLLMQNWYGFRNKGLSTYYTRNIEKPMGVVIPSVTNSSESKYRGPVEPRPKNLLVPEVQNVNKRSGIIQICATEAVLDKVQDLVYGREKPGADQVEKAKSILMEQERAILEALAKLADVTNEDNSPKGH